MLISLTDICGERGLDLPGPFANPFSRLLSGESGLSQKHRFLSPTLPQENLRGIARALRVRRVIKLMDQLFGLVF